MEERVKHTCVTITIATLTLLMLSTSSAQKSIPEEIQAQARAERNREAIGCQLKYLAMLAQQHFYRPAAEGGGGTFDGSKGGNAWTIPRGSDTTANGTYSLWISANQVTIVGVGREYGASRNAFVNAGGDTGKVQATCTVTPSQAIVIKNN